MSPATPALLALAAMVLGGVGDFVYKRGAHAGLPAHRFLMVQTWTFGPTVVLYGVLSDSLVFNVAALWGCLAGLFAFTGFYNFARSLRTGLVSVNAPIFRMSFVVTVVLAVAFLGERLTSWKLAGMASVLVAVGLVAAGAPAARAARAIRAARSAPASLAQVAVATTAVGAANFLYKIGLTAGATSSSLLTAQACIVSGLAVGTVLAVDGRIRVSRTAWRHAGTAGIVLALAFIGLTEALARGDATVVVPIAQMGFLVTALLGVVLMKERIGRPVVIGLVAGAVGIVFLAAG